jgi:hypothetical protein
MSDIQENKVKIKLKLPGMDLGKPLVLLPLVIFLRHVDLQRSASRTRSESIQD